MIFLLNKMASTILTRLSDIPKLVVPFEHKYRNQFELYGWKWKS